MAAKKIYAVKRGKTTGIFETWEQCKASVDGFPKAEYKSFTKRSEAEEYLGLKPSKLNPVEQEEVPPEGRVLAYVDGSYEDSVRKYAFGCIFLLPNGKIYVQYGNGENEDSLKHRNVTGEMLGAMYAVRAAIMSGYREIEIRYDYEGIEKWARGMWKTNTERTSQYAQAMKQWGELIRIQFTKVAAHTNVKYNELADQMAKKGLTDGEGVPKVCRIEEMTLWNP